MARSDELLILANRIDAIGDSMPFDLIHPEESNQPFLDMCEDLFDIARELREYVKGI